MKGSIKTGRSETLVARKNWTQKKISTNLLTSFVAATVASINCSFLEIKTNK